MRKMLVAFLAVSLVTATSAVGQVHGADPVGDALFPPEIVISHQRELGLSDRQNAAIQSYVQDAQVHFTRTQWRLGGAAEQLVSILRQPHPSEAQALKQLDTVLGFEHEIKRAQLTLMVRIKNELTSQQQSSLQRMKQSAAAH